MDTAMFAEYRKYRARGISAKYALRTARALASPPLHEWTNDRAGNRVATVEQDGYRVTLRTSPDYDMGLDDMGYGSFTDTFERGAVKNPHPHGPTAEAKWYIPTEDIASVVAYYRKGGASRSVALDMARAQQAEEAETAAYYHDIVSMTATASRAGVELGTASIGGCELSGNDTEDDHYLDDMAGELVDEAITEAKEALARLVAA